MTFRSRRTVRMRLTALYCVLFVLSAVVLLVITNGVGSTDSEQEFSVGGTTTKVVSVETGLSHRYLLGSAIGLGVMLAVSVVAGWVIAGRALRPVRQMTATTRRISARNLHERLAIEGPGDELKDLADTIDALLGRLDGAFAAQRRFVANASHELRTPLAAMRASVDVAVAKPRPVPPETITLAGQVRAELDKVDQLLDGLLVLARAEHGALPGQAILPLDYVVAAALAAHQDAITARNLTVQHVSGGDDVWIEGSQPLVRRLADNLISNAIAHNHDGGWIAVTTRADGGAARLIVENGGDVLESAQVAGLAQPFRRLGADRTGSDDGAGLGLSIVAAITQAHQGSLQLDARPGGGLTAAITLPLAPRAVAAAEVVA